MAIARIFGAVITLALACGSAHAQTSCNATNLFTLDWDAQTPKNTALGTGARTFTVTNLAGQTVTVTMTFAGETASYIDSGYGQTPNISVQNVGGIGATENTLFLATDFLGYTTNITSTTNVAVVRFSFSVPVRDVAFKIMDIDYSAGQFRDWVRVNTSNGATNYTPVLASPYGSRNNVSNPGLTAPGVAYIGPGTTAGYTFVSGDLIGTGISALNQDFGLINTSSTVPITQAEVRYGNGPASTMTGTAGIQSIAIHDISFCPMPVLSMTKTAAPVATTGDNRFNIPGADVDYTITVTNTGGSPVDINTATIGDLLPANVTFFNGDIDTATAGTQNFVFTPGTSGLTLAAANITYLNAANAPITPAVGYDANVRTVRWQPQGTMAANSSFAIRFRTQIK